MAGAGYKLFNTGDVLTAAQVNTYLNEQTVMVFASSAARTSALSGVLAEGMMSYLQDTNAVEVYNGSTWVNVGNAGDITEVQAGVGISIASGTGPIPVITNSSTDLITTAGDLLYGTAADTVARLGIGTAGQVLKVNSGATAPEWGTVAAGGFTLINSGGTTISGNTTVSSIGGYTHLFFLLEGVGRSSGSGTSMGIRFNGDTGANYNWARFGSFNSGTASSCGFEKAGGFIEIAFRYGSSTNFNNGNFGAGWVYRYGSSDDKAVSVFMNGTDGAPNTTPLICHTSAAYNTSSAITSITIMADQTLDTGKIFVYGVN
jgi:hypothetical protein